MNMVTPNTIKIVDTIYTIKILVFCFLSMFLLAVKGKFKESVLKMFTEKVLLNDVPIMMIILVRFSAKLKIPTSAVV